MTGAGLISLQLLEWHLLAKMVQFQATCEIGLLVVRKDSYLVLEQVTVKRFTQFCCAAIILDCVSLVMIYASEKQLQGSSHNSDRLNLTVYQTFRVQDFIVYYVLLVAIFIVCLRLRRTLKENQNSLYLDNWKDLWL